MDGRNARYVTRTRHVIVASVILGLLVTPLAFGFGDGRSILGGKRNPSANATRAFSNETEIIASNGTYGTRQSNKGNGDGGGAIYGCRSSSGNEPCLRGNNLKGGRAFEFNTTGGEAGQITVGNSAGRPFSTNAQGVATGLNADKVDGKDASELGGGSGSDTLGALISAVGGVSRSDGVTSASVVGTTYNVTFTRDVSACRYQATAQGTTSAADIADLVVGNGATTSQVRVDATAPTGFFLSVFC